MMQDFAPGIPDKNIKATLPTLMSPTSWEFVLQHHIADKAGPHFDLRLGDPSTGYAHSWVVRSWPRPGEKVLAIEQPRHIITFMDFKGTIESGYGAGSVNIVMRDKVEIIKSTPTKITFYKYTGSNVERYTLVNTNGDNWLLINHSVPANLEAAPKFKMKELPRNYIPKELDFETPKIDGAFASIILQKDKIPIVTSSRISKKTQRPIEYTPKIQGLLKPTPASLHNTILRGEVYAITPEGQELPNRSLGGMLNANVWTSREMQRQSKTPLRIAATDVLKYKGKDVSNLPISEKFRIINEVKKQLPEIENPLDLQSKVNFKEGKVIWRNGIPYKLKYKPDYDVYVKEIYPNKNNERAGGFRYSLSPDGPIVGNVGTGFAHAELDDMLKNRQDYIGRVAKIQAMEQHPSGAYRSPSMLGWHTDK